MRKLSLKELNRVDIHTFKKASKNPIVIVLDNIRSAHNVGAAFRTADAFALEHLYLCGITATPPHREILKTAIGASESVDWSYFKQTQDAITQLKEQEYQIVGIEQADESTPLQSFCIQPEDKIALIFGNEVKGIDDKIMQMLDHCVEIPQYGTKHSINVSVCIGILCWEMLKQQKSKI